MQLKEIFGKIYFYPVTPRLTYPEEIKKAFLEGTTVIDPITKLLVMPTLCIPSAPGQPEFRLGRNAHKQNKSNIPHILFF